VNPEEPTPWALDAEPRSIPPTCFVDENGHVPDHPWRCAAGM
jgi:hypothetical protein